MHIIDIMHTMYIMYIMYIMCVMPGHGGMIPSLIPSLILLSDNPTPFSLVAWHRRDGMAQKGWHGMPSAWWYGTSKDPTIGERRLPTEAKEEEIPFSV